MLSMWFTVHVQVQVRFTSVDGQVQPLDVALGHSVLSNELCDTAVPTGTSYISHLEYSVVSLIRVANRILANGA
jgi:predicted cupin superfamily sugar epimerase